MRGMSNSPEPVNSLGLTASEMRQFRDDILMENLRACPEIARYIECVARLKAQEQRWSPKN